MTVNEELKQLKDAVGDLTSHVVAALDMLDAGLAAAADGQAGADTLSTLHSQIQRNKSHIADVRTRISKLDQDEKDQIYLLRRNSSTSEV